MTRRSQASYQLALRDFHQARKQAVMQQILARFRGEGAQLLDFHQVQQQLRPTGMIVTHGLQEIPLEKIVGSVDRYEDFTRSFLPKRDSDEARWAGVRAAVDDMVGIPPIDVYQVGDAYFVQDGNHRVSIARRLRSKTISAQVTEMKTRVPLTADDNPNEIICKSYYADFLEKTNLDKLRADVDLLMTFCGQYPSLLDQIAGRLELIESSQAKRDESDLWEEAVVDWYDRVYLPVIRVIRELGVLHRFPERTEADMYVLLSERRAELERDLGWHVEMETGVSDLITSQDRSRGLLSRVVKPLDSSPTPGLWRQQQLARQRYHHLFDYSLVALDGTEAGWQIFDYILQAATVDNDHILGLHVVPDKAQVDSQPVRQMRARFEADCREAGVQGEFAVEVDNKPVRAIIKRAAWVDFVIVNSPRPPDNQPLARISAGLKQLVQQCPRPIQIRPDGTQSDLSRVLLAYDGSPKADEALFIATYLVARWPKSLTVVTVETAQTSEEALERARRYLEQHGVTNVDYVLRQGPIAEMVLETAATYRSNELFMGGFSFRSLRQLTLGSSAERILREFPHPMWICR